MKQTKRKLLSGLLAVTLLLQIALPSAAFATESSRLATMALTEDKGADSSEPVPMSGEALSAPAPLPEPEPGESLTQGRIALRASEISIVGVCVYANGIPIVIKQNNSITSVYGTDGTLLSGEIDVKDKWIYGGVAKASGDYVGDTSITVESGTLTKSIYGGNGGSNLTGDTHMTINGGTVAYLFGGNENFGTITGDTFITINGGNITGWVYGGSAIYENGGPSNVLGSTHVTLNGGTVKNNIYGGGSWRGATVNNSNVTVNGGSVYAVFGGGESESTVSEKATVIIDQDPNIRGWVYGGGAGFDNSNAIVNNADVQIKSGNLNVVFGGGASYINEGGAPTTSNTTGNVSISVSGGTISALAASQDAQSKVTGDVSISLTGGTINQSCHLTGYYQPDNAIKNVTLTVGEGMHFGESAYVEIREKISGDLNIDIDGTFVKLDFWDDVLPQGKEAKVTYRNIGSEANTWTQYYNDGRVQTVGTNPQMFSPGYLIGSPMFRNNKLTEFTLVNSYVDFRDESIVGTPKDFASFTDKLTLDGGALRCYFQMNSKFPATEFINEPLLYDGYFWQGTGFGTSTMDFAAVTGTAKVQLLPLNGSLTDPPFGNYPVPDNGLGCVTAPTSTPEGAFILQNNEVTEDKYLWGTNTQQSGNVTSKVWQVYNTEACRCFIGEMNMKDKVFYLGESDAFTLADYRDGKESTESTANCPLVGHKGSQYQLTYTLVSGEHTTAPEAVITGNQLTAAGVGSLEVEVKATLNGKESKDKVILYIAERPIEKQYYFCIDPDSAAYQDITIAYGGADFGTTSRNTLWCKKPSGYLGKPNDFDYVTSDNSYKLTIKKAYLAKLAELGLKDYQFEVNIGMGEAFPYAIAYDTITINIFDKASSALTLSADKNENIVYGDSVTYQAVVAAAAKDDDLGTPDVTGTVQFELDGENYGSALPLATAKITLDHTTLTAGNHTVTATYSGDNNYSGATATVNATVAKAALTLKPKDIKITAGETLPANEVVYSGLVGGDLSSVVQLAGGNLDMAYRNAADDGVPVNTGVAGDYKIVFIGSPVFQIADNYTITTGDGTLTVSARPSSGGGSSSSGGGNTTVTTPPANTTNPNPPTRITTIVAPGISDDTATMTVLASTVKTAISKAQAEGKKNGTTANGIAVEIKADTKSAANLTVNLPKATVDALVQANVKEIRITSGVATISFNWDALKEIQQQTGSDVMVTATKVANTTLSAEAKAVVGNRPVYDLSITAKNGTKVTGFGQGKASVFLPYTPGAGETPGNVAAYYIDSNGRIQEIPDSVYDSKTKTVNFIIDHFSQYGVGYKTSTVIFTDTSDHWARDDIEFVAARGLLMGTGDTTFSPNQSMTRGMFVTALGRLAGIDTKKYESTEFTDVNGDAYYAPYVAWATQKGIANGTGVITFSPDKAVTRREMAVMLVNYSKAIGYELPTVCEEVIFTDSASIGAWANEAVKQTQMAGILMGKSDNRFDPTATATRAEVSAVLHRYVELMPNSQTPEG